MKIVINKCFGGFGLSEEALIALAKSECTHVERIEPREYYGGLKWEEEFKRDTEGTSIFKLTIVNGKIITHNDHYDQARSCPYLVQVVEQLADKANGCYAKLKIVEIPDNIQFTIEEYDGQEHVAQQHMTWD